MRTVSHINKFSQDILLKHLLKRASQLKDSEIRIFEYLFPYFRSYKSVRVSQVRIARELGYCRQTVNEGIRTLSEHGFIAKTTWLKQTCNYYLHPDFKLNKNLKKLTRVFVFLYRYVKNACNPTLTSSSSYTSSNNTVERKRSSQKRRIWKWYESIGYAITGKLGEYEELRI